MFVRAEVMLRPFKKGVNMKIVKTNSNFIREPLKAPFGFKGGYLNELWQVVSKIETGDEYGIGLGVQSVLWSDANVFSQVSR